MGDYFDKDDDMPFMARAPSVRSSSRARCPGAIHKDGTSRVQTVDQTAGLLFDILNACEAKFALPMVINTSMNFADKPIVETPAEAIEFFQNTDLQFLVMNDALLEKR